MSTVTVDKKVGEDEFGKIPPTESAFVIWRVENFKLVPWPQNQFGQFFTGDAYVLYNAVKKASFLSQDIYFWIGSEATTDEYGAAAIYSVQLDQFFEDKPIQHREVEGFETDGFVALFEKYGGIQFVEGGVKTGFKTVDTSVKTRLYQIKGVKIPSLKQVKPKGSSLNQGDPFILTTQDKIFLWIGQKASPKESYTAGQVFSKWKLEKKLKDVRLDGGETTPEFWEALGGETPIAEASASDAEFESRNKLTIFVIKGPAAGNYEKLAEGAAATPALLKTGSVYVVHRGHKAVVWLPKGYKEADPVGTAVAVVLQPQKLERRVSLTVAKEGVKSDELENLFL